MLLFLAIMFHLLPILQFDEGFQIQSHVERFEWSSYFSLQPSFQILKHQQVLPKHSHHNARILPPYFHHKYLGNEQVYALPLSSGKLPWMNACPVQKRFRVGEFPHDLSPPMYRKRPHRECFFRRLLPCEYVSNQWISRFRHLCE